MSSPRLIILKTTDNRQVLISIDSLDSIEELGAELLRVSTRHTTVEVSTNFKDFMALIAKVYKDSPHERTTRSSQNP